MLSGGDDGTLKFFKPLVPGAILRNLQGHTGPIFSAAFSPDGKYIAWGSRDNTIKFWG